MCVWRCARTILLYHTCTVDGVMEPGTLHVHVATCTRAVYLLLIHVQSQERALCNNCTKKQLCNSLHRKFMDIHTKTYTDHRA